MKIKASIVVSFVAGACFAAILAIVLVLRWHEQQSKMFWSSYLQTHATDALRLSRGEQERVLLDMERRLPGIVQSVHAHGDGSETHGALRRALEFYLETGKLVPREIDGILSSPGL